VNEAAVKGIPKDDRKAVVDMAAVAEGRDGRRNLDKRQWKQLGHGQDSVITATILH